MALSEERKRQLELARDRIVAEARILGVTVQEHAADQIADMKTTARDSIIRTAVVCSCLGTIIGFILCMVLVK